MSGRVRPARPFAPIAVAAMILGIWWLVAHNSGAGWVQVLGDLVFGALCIGIIGPSVVLGRAKVRVVHAPMDGVVGSAVVVRIEASTRLRIRAVDSRGNQVFVGPVRRGGSVDDRITLLPERRGVYDTVALDIATAAPFALQWWTRRVHPRLPSPLHIAPRRGRPEPLPWRPREDDGGNRDFVRTDDGEPRGARPYRPGDHRRQVHWRATAHSGELMVRELERPSAEPIAVTVVLPRDPEEAERVAERALGTVVFLLDRGAPVLLATVEAGGPLLAMVVDRRMAGRRLARAVARGDTPSESPGIAVAL
jgi:uncharacterized protein (DUF58 family)